jgi:PKD repeat protein
MPKNKPHHNLSNKGIAHFSAISKVNLLAVALIFVAIGTIVLIRSFASNPNLPGDLNNDNIVNISDLSLLLSNYGSSSTVADINGDGTVNIADLSMLLSNYGKSYNGSTAPVADFDFSPAAPVVGQSVSFSFSGTCSATPCSYTYGNLQGDGSYATFGTSANASFTYQFTGTKTVKLTVTDSQSRSDSITKDVVVGSNTTPPPPPPPAGGGGNGTITFDGTFTNPPPGPNWPSRYGTCYTYIAADQLSFTPQSSCSPLADHLRTDLCTASGCSATASGGQVYKKGVASCTTIPFYLPKQIPTASGNSWFQISEMKDYSSPAADWSIGLANGGASHLSFSAATTTNKFNPLYDGPGPVSAGVWHTASVCTNNNDIIYNLWFDGQQLTGNAGTCNGKQQCTGLNLFYDGYSTQPLDINAYTGNTSGTDPWGGYTVIHGDPLIMSIPTSGWNGLPPKPPGGWNSP